MKPIVATLAAIAVLAIAAPAGARPIDAYGPIPSDAPADAGQVTSHPSPGTETWVVIAAAVLAFAAGASAARLVPVARAS
jgi:hypothetical protein